MPVLNQNALRQMNEADLRQEVIMPLMEKMGYRGVHEWHGGVGELGKDVLGWKEGDFGSRMNLAVVAKAARISGSTVREVTRQIRQAFNTPFEDPITHEEEQVHRVWVVTNKEVPTDSKPGIWSDIDIDKHRHVEIIDGDALWRAWKEHFPVELYQAIEEAQRRLKGLDIGFRTRVWLEPEARGVEVRERYPGQLEAEPVTGKVSFQFSDTPEGRAKAEELQAAWATGTTARIPGEYVRQFMFEELDSLAEQVLGVKPDKITSLEISSVENPKPGPVRIEIQSDDGDQALLDYVEWQIVQAGVEEITLSNEAQPIPIQVTQVINLQDGSSRSTFTRKDGPIAALWWLQWLRLQQCFGKPCRVLVTLVESGARLLVGRREGGGGAAVDPRWLAIIVDLAAVQDKLGQAIFIPEGGFTEAERATVGKLRSLLREPQLAGRWEHVEAGCTANDVQTNLGHFLRGEQGGLRHIEEEQAELAGIPFSLGRVLYLFESARIANGLEVREQIANAANGDTEITIRFEPGTSNRAVIRYLDWVTGPGQSDQQQSAR